MTTALASPIPVTQLTDEKVAGSGIFDVLMRATKAHLEQEYTSGRITGANYSTVYLGALEATMRTALEFVLQKQKVQQEINVLLAQECKLKAEFDLTVETTKKAIQETALMQQKVATERAQVIGTGVDVDSVIGRQKNLYFAQAEGFKRDAEQKVAKVLVDTWNVRRTTDEATSANVTNLLDDGTIGRAMTKLLAGVGA